MALENGGSQSAQTWTGVGPKHAFIFSCASTPVVDNIIGVDVTVAQASGAGMYTITHNLGKTGYVGIFTAEESEATPGLRSVRIYDRSANTTTVWIEEEDGSLEDANFVHGVIYD
tara:strand:+ start:57 stop:401 length:345 start_codon:yes stop_codon:yes gene_type:complete